MHSILEFAWAYNLMQFLSGWHGERQARFVSEVVRPSPGDRVLDIGCGTAAVRARLGEVDYTGMDMNRRYIDYASRHQGNGRFLCANVNDFDFAAERKFDIILMLGLIHHLNDPDAARLLTQARNLLAPSGRLVTMDACRTDDQGGFERWMVGNDRGHYIRRIDAYVTMAKSIFQGVTAHTRKDLVRYTYTFLIMECSLSGAEPAARDSAVAVPEAG